MRKVSANRGDSRAARVNVSMPFAIIKYKSKTIILVYHCLGTKPHLACKYTNYLIDDNYFKFFFVKNG